MKSIVTSSAKQKRRDIWFLVLPIVSILTPVVIMAAFIGWFLSDFAQDSYVRPTGSDRFVNGLTISALFICGVAIKFWYLSLAFCVVCIHVVWRLFIRRSHARNTPNQVA